MSTSKRRAADDVSEQGDASSLSGTSAMWHADKTRADGPCPKTSCACPGEFHSPAPPAAPEAEQSCKAQKTLARKMSSRTWRKKRWTSPILPKRYDITTASSACARSSRLTTATTLQIASFDPSAHRFCLRKCSGPSKSRWSDYSHLQVVSSRGLSAGRSSRISPTACSSRSSRSLSKLETRCLSRFRNLRKNG